MRTLLTFVLLVTLGTTVAQTLQDARNLYARGEFQAAANVAAALKTSDALAFAAKATSIHASTQPEREQEAIYAKAEEYARQAIKADPKNADAYFELARSLGRLSQLRGVLAALVQGLGTQVKENLDKALELDPKHASSKVALALWHAEITAKGAGWLYGANGARVEPLFEEAIALEPNRIIHRVEYAKALLLLDKERNKAKARAQLQAAVRMTPDDAAERLDLERAKRDLAAIG